MLEKEIEAYALQNAIEFGKTDASKILPKLFQHGLKKEDIKQVMPKIQEIVKHVNALSQPVKEKNFEKFKDVVKVHEHQEGLPELQVSGKVVTRLAPEPSKYNHIGHALVFLIQHMYARKYKGKCILRIEDTNPEKSTSEYYNAMKEDLKWIGLDWDEEVIASNDMSKFYSYAEQLIRQKDAFVCSCSQDTMKRLREKMEPCKCRNSESMKEWKAMLDKKYKEGEKTLRLKGNMESNNGVMRDPVIFRISYATHFLQKKKYGVWPTYDFENPIEDSINGVTHVIRSAEFELRAELHDFILSKLGLKGPIVREIGRYRIAGAETQGRTIREMIERHEIEGWDDPRLVTIKALRRRGFVPEMFHELAKTVGLSKSSGQIDFSVLESINRKIIDTTARRYFFISKPVKIKVENAPEMKVKAPLHPSQDHGSRQFTTENMFYIEEKDSKELAKSKYIRFMHLFNAEVKGKKIIYHSSELDLKLKTKFIHWLPADPDNEAKLVKTEIVMPDASRIEGFSEQNISKVKVGDIVQFERFGFCRLDSKEENKLVFWFTHQ